MALLLSTSQQRAWLRNLTVGTDLAPSAATNASPAVLTMAATATLATGDIVASWGFATNTNCNGVFYVNVINGTTLNLVSLTDGSTLIVGNGATSAGHMVRLTVALNPHDIENMLETLDRIGFKRDSDATWLAATAAQTANSNVDGSPGFLESPIQTLLGF